MSIWISFECQSWSVPAQGAHVEEAFSKGKEEPPVRIAAKYIVSPDEAKAFLEIFEKQKEQALKHDGTVAYRLFKTLVRSPYIGPCMEELLCRSCPLDSQVYCHVLNISNLAFNNHAQMG